MRVSVRLLELTLSTVPENLALDEALLEAAELDASAVEVLRLWESPETAVILGRASRWDDEAKAEICAADGVPVYRRASGGAAVAIGPGCLMYSLIISLARRPELALIDAAHQWVMQSLLTALRPLVPDVQFQGTCDLTWRGKKFSGNSLRCKRTHLLYHGTLLYDFNLPLIARYLGTPPRQPAYREGRDHDSFVTNLPVDGRQLSANLVHTFEAHERLLDWPRERTCDLAINRYQTTDWNRAR